MEKIKKNAKLKEPVRLRAKKLANGNQSLYLDTYIEGKRSYEFLRIYLIPEKTPDDRMANAVSLKAAYAIKASRIISIINGRANIKVASPDLSIESWIERIIVKKSGIRSRSSIMLMRRLIRHLHIYKKGVLLQEVDRPFCMGFVDYLRAATALNSTKPLTAATQYELLNALSIALNEAVREDMIRKNPMSLLTVAERIRKPESNREYLTRDELRRLISVSGQNIREGDDVAAFLFCCLCGLRYSDVVALKWRDIKEKDNGREISITMIKTQRPVAVPLSKQASSILPPKGAPDNNVFSFPSYGITLRRLKKSATAAGIGKKVTFHVSRHTFATMMITAGADLYTISKLIGHTDIRTTQIYSKVVDQKKREAVALLDRFF